MHDRMKKILIRFMDYMKVEQTASSPENISKIKNNIFSKHLKLGDVLKKNGMK